MVDVFVLRATKKLLERIKPATIEPSPISTTLFGDWYATALFWQPQVALLVNERTLLPVLMPLAPAATLPARFPAHLGEVLDRQGVAAEVIAAELAQMREYQVAKTANRSVLGIITDFTHLLDVYRDRSPSEPDLPTLAARLATTPCGPLYRSHTRPDRELAALVAAHTTPSG